MPSSSKNTHILSESIHHLFLNLILEKNFSILKILFYLKKRIHPVQVNQHYVLVLEIDEMSEYCELSSTVLLKNIHALYQTPMLYENKKEGEQHKNLLFSSLSAYQKNKKIELGMMTEQHTLFSSICNAYVYFDFKNTFYLTTKESVLMVHHLEQHPQSNVYSLEALNRLFNTNINSFKTFTRKILEPLQEELNTYSEHTFSYQVNQETVKHRKRDINISIVYKSQRLKAKKNKKHDEYLEWVKKLKYKELDQLHLNAKVHSQKETWEDKMNHWAVKLGF